MMASFQQMSNGTTKAQVWIKPLPRQSRTFPARDQAEFWAQQTEIHLRAMREQQRFRMSEDTKPRRLRSPDEVHRLPRVILGRGVSGVYFLYHQEECVYVGQSVNVHARVRDHMRGEYAKSFDSYSWLATQLCELAALEAYYITLLQPKLNAAGLPSGSMT
jgi:hypothetical protein